MKLYLTIAVILLGFNLQAQEHFNGSITYAQQTTFVNKADSIECIERNFGTDYLDMIMRSVKEKYLVKDDSVLIYCYYRSEEVLKELYLSTKGNLQRIDMISGGVRDWKVYPKKYKRLKSYRRIENEDKIILGFKCSAWVAKRKKGWRKIWLANVNQILPETKDSEIIMDNQLILRQVTFLPNYQQRVKQAVSIDKLPVTKFSEIIKKNTAADIQWKYAPIVANESLDDAVVKVGDLAPDAVYREMFGNGTKRLYETTKKSQYTMLEFWGTWCMPCLAATPKIKNLREKFNENELSIISLNTRDKIVEKIKGVIKKKGMNWEHGYSTKKLISIFNDDHSYPRVVLLDKNNKVLLIGNPHEVVEEIEGIISETLSKK